MKYCEHCGELLKDDAVFCDECGTAQTSEVEPAPHEPPMKKRSILIPVIIIIILLIGEIGGFFIYQRLNKAPSTQEEQKEYPTELAEDEGTATTLLESADWIDDSKKIEEFKKLSLTAYPDKPIGDTFTGNYSVTEWKYAADDSNIYLLCSYTYGEQDYTLIFYQDTYSNVNFAEYYIGEQQKESDDIKAVAEEIFGQDDEPEEEPQNNTTEESNTEEDIQNSTPAPRTDGNVHATIDYISSSSSYYYILQITDFSDGGGFNFTFYKWSEGNERQLI